jgi:hypothetical protein
MILIDADDDNFDHNDFIACDLLTLRQLFGYLIDVVIALLMPAGTTLLP